MQNGNNHRTSANPPQVTQSRPPAPPPIPTTTTIPSLKAAKPSNGNMVEDLSTVELVKQITTEVGHLAQKQIELAKAELKADLKSEAIMVGGLSLAAVGGLCTLNLLLVTVVFAIGSVMQGWLAGLIVSGATLAITAIVAAIAWSKRVRSPMARTKRSLREDVQWTKERLV